MKNSTSRSIIRGSVWTAWFASTFFTKGLSLPLAPWIEKASEIASSLIESVVANWASEDLRAESITPESIGENGHMERLVSLSISAVILQLPELDQRATPHAGLCKELADTLGDAWPALNKLNRPVPADTRGASEAWDEKIFDRLGGSELHKNILAYIREPRKTNVFTIELWHDIIGGVLLVKGLHIPEIVHTAAAEALHRELPRFLYDATKLAADDFPEAYAAVQLRILEQQTEILESLHTHATEMAEWLGVQFTEVKVDLSELKTALAGQALKQTRIVAELTSLNTKADTIDRKQDAQLTLLANIFTRLAKLEISLPQEISALLKPVGEDAKRAADNTEVIRDEIEQLRKSQQDAQTELVTIRAELTAARALLARTVHQLPAFAKPTVLPVAASKLFGRDADLVALRELFLARKQIAITGTGGLGKTALCSEFLRILSTDPATQHLVANGIFLHDFYKQPTLQGFIASILGQAAVDVRDDTERLALVIRILQQPGIVLYIEGGEKIGQLSVLEPFLSPGTHVLFTTRIPKQPDAIDTFQLQPLKIDAAAHAIHHYADALSRQKKHSPFPFPIADPGWPLLARDLGGLPLACRIAGHYCAARTTAPEKLHALLEREGLQRIITGDDSRANLHILFTQSARVLTPAALHAWSALTFGGASHTPVAILRAIGIVDDTALEMLCDHGIATADFAMSPETGENESAYALAHALLAEWGRRELDKIEGTPATPRPTHAEVVVEARKWALNYWEKFKEHPEIHCRPEQYRHTAPIAEGILREVEPLTELPANVRDSFYYLPARMHQHHGQFALAEPIYRRCVERMKADTGESSAEYATAISNLAELLRATNRLEETERLMREALKIREQIHEINAPEIAIALNNLAALLHDTNRLWDAEPLMRRALEIFKASYGEGHPNVAVQLNNLAQLLQDTKRLGEAEPLMRRALAIDEAGYGPMHPQVAIDLNNLATLYYSTNRLGEAEPMMRRALEIDEASFGPMHPKVAIRLNNLARLLQDTNRLGEAEPLMRRVVEIILQFTAQTGHEHPHLRAVVRNFAGLLFEMGRPPEEIRREIGDLYGQYGVEFQGV